MTEKLIVNDKIVINAGPERVWEVLIKPKYVAQWGELPDNYPSEDMKVGSEVVWELPNGGKTIMKVIKADKNKELIIALYSSNWEVKPIEGDVAYHYKLEDLNGSTYLKIEIGDFSQIKNGQNYYDASVEFAAESKEIIKQLAEDQ